MFSRLAGTLATLGLVLALAPPSAAVTIGAGSGSGIAGQTVDIAITTGDLTGLGVMSYQFAITYSASVVTAVDVIEAGTLTGTAGWGDATFNVTSGRIAVSHAGTSALSGSGPLLFLRFQIPASHLSSGSTSLTFQSFLFNEGSPPATTTGGSIIVNATPIITVSPNTGEIVKGQTLQFSVSGSVTQPVSWSTSNPAVAGISSNGPLTGLLTGLAPGAVRVTAIDNAARQDQTDGDILVRGMGLTVGTGSAFQGNSGSVNVTVTDLTGLGVRSGQLKVSFNASHVTAAGVSTSGTMLDGYGTTSFGVEGSTLAVSFAGTTDLSGSGVLCRLDFTASATSSGLSNLALTEALFNETLPALKTNGSFTVNALPTITVSPENVTLLVGQTQQFTVSGGATPPITWSTLDPTVASINSSGLLSALAGGVTRVRAVDAVGAADENTAVTVHDFQVSLPTLVAGPGSTVRVPLLLDRVVGGMDIRSLQYTLIHGASVVASATAAAEGLAGAWGTPTANSMSDRIAVATAGAQPLTSSSTELHVVYLTLSSSAPIGTDLPLVLSGFMTNEGRPSGLTVNGLLQVRSVTGVEGESPTELSLAPGVPNPFGRAMRIAFTVPRTSASGMPVRLAIFGPDGRRLRVLLDETLAPGRYGATWDGRDANGRAAAAGIYFVRLEAPGRSAERKIVRVE